MPQADAELLDRLTSRANVAPFCIVSRADMLRLLELTGFGPGTLWWREVSEGDDPTTIYQHPLLVLIAWARGESPNDDPPIVPGD